MDCETLHPQWWVWLAENFTRGATADELEAALQDEGISASLRKAAVAEVSSSPMTPAVTRLLRRIRALEQIITLRAQHRDLIPPQPQRWPELDDFRQRFWCPGTPGLFTDLVRRWPAFERWSMASFRERFGGELVQACVGRETLTGPDPLWERCATSMTLAVFLDRIEAGAGNDAYIIAKNALLQRPAFAPLLADVELDPAVFGGPLDPKRASLWLGGAGTHTPLHHDGDNTMFCQVVGRKQFWLAPPEDLSLLDRGRGVYASFGEHDVGERTASQIELVLQPGDALFIPAGWWHRVEALDPSISVSIQHFAWPNEYHWYRPNAS